MKKRLLFILLMLHVGLAGMWAQEVSEKEAQVKAQKFVNSHYGRKGGGSELKSLGQVNGLYVFNMNDRGGFVIVSNDERATEILGYSESGQFDPDNMPDNMRAWLQGYADEIAWAQKNIKEVTDANTKTRARTRAHATTDIDPMVTTKWNQRAPYNNLCPEYNPGKKAVTGCVATAMAQVMYYTEKKAYTGTDFPNYTTTTTQKIDPYDWKYNGITYTSESIPAGSVIEWGNMLDNYVSKDPNTGNTIINGTEAQQNAVATLMKYCGYSVQMNYGPSSSSNSIMVANALTTYFNYSTTTKVVSRGCYSYANWIDLIYHELEKGRPVVYGGQSYGGGHEFVCDGYKYEFETDYFHINWGWGGQSDEYYVLSVLNPYAGQGAGGSSSNDGFHFGQDAVVGIQKAGDTDPVLNVPTNKYTLNINDISISHNKIALGESVDITLNVTNSGTEAYDGDLLLVKGGYVFWGEMFIIPANTTGNYVIHYTPTNAGTETISSVFTDNDGDFSVQSKAVTLSTVNQTPTDLSATNISSTTASIGWTNVGNANKWNLRSKKYSITTEDFNGDVSSWRISDGNSDNYTWRIIANAGVNGSPCYASPSCTEGNSLNPKDWLISPQFNLGGKLSFYAWGENECFRVWISTDGHSWTNDTPYNTTTSIAKLYTFDLSKYEGVSGYIAIIHENSSGHTSESFLYIDDVSHIVPNGEWSTINQDYVTNNSYIMSGLTPNTGYEVQVQAVINGGGKWSNSSFFIKSNGIVLENSTENSVKDIPEQSVNVNVSLTNRTLYKDDNWNTLCLPFSLSTEQIAASSLANATIMELDNTSPTGFDATTGTLNLNFKSANSIVAGTPYIIKWASGSNIVNPVFNGVTIDKTKHDVSFDGGKFVGTYESQTFTDENTSILFVGDGNSLFYPKAGASIGAQRAYFQIGSTIGIRAFNLNFGDDEVTGIISIENGKLKIENDSWYDLSGRKLNGKPVKKGVYVQNGKKIVIK